jgi:hypothetical protein
MALPTDSGEGGPQYLACRRHKILGLLQRFGERGDLLL